MFLPVSPQTDLFLLLFVSQHSLHGQPGDQRNIVNRIGISGHADDALLATLMHDCHIDTRKNAGEFLFIMNNDHILTPAYDPVGHRMISTDPSRITACDDHAALIHDVDIIFGIFA